MSKVYWTRGAITDFRHRFQRNQRNTFNVRQNRRPVLGPAVPPEYPGGGGGSTVRVMTLDSAIAAGASGDATDIYDNTITDTVDNNTGIELQANTRIYAFGVIGATNPEAFPNTLAECPTDNPTNPTV